MNNTSQFLIAFLIVVLNSLLFEVCNVEFHVGSFLDGVVLSAIWMIILKEFDE